MWKSRISSDLYAKKRRHLTVYSIPLLIAHALFGILLLAFVSTESWSRLIVVIMSVISFILLLNQLKSYRPIVGILSQFFLFFFFQYLIAILVNRMAYVQTIKIPGMKQLTKDFPMGTSGDARVVVGPDGVVPSPFSSINTAGVIDTAARSAIADGVPYVTGDDFSIIIPCRNEGEYLSKTIKFTIDNTPRQYIKEIIIVDDGSDIPISDLLDKELSDYYRQVVTVYRLNEKQGLIRARIYGADHSTASNIFFLDGHCKPKVGWIQPLLQHLKANYKRVACPVIEDIKKDTWEDVGTSGAKMMFEWTFEFGWYDDLTDEVPISAGGILAITRQWWEESGKYDPGMYEWGGENLEQSMRVWMCGGEIFVVRNSFVGHIFDRPPKPNPENKLVTQVQKNQKRGALVWLDDYYQYFEKFHPVVKGLDPGPGIEERLALRHRLKCLPFQWYVDKFRTSFERKSLLVDEFRYIRHLSSRLCLTAVLITQNGKSQPPNLALVPCQKNNLLQEWLNVAGGRLLFNRETEKCVEAKDAHIFSGERHPLLMECDWSGVFLAESYHQFWHVDGIKTQRIVSYVSSSIQTITGNDKLILQYDHIERPTSHCLTSTTQFWDLNQTNSTSLEENSQELIIPITVSSCQPVKGLLGTWNDPQAFEWYW